MENLKIKVSSEAESKEAQELLGFLGFNKVCWMIYLEYFIFANNGYYSNDCIDAYNDCEYKEITLPQLRDLVVLKRNDINDATHYTDQCGAKGFLSSDGVEYFWNYSSKEWIKAKNLNFMKYQMKPIEKEMKEYLDKDYVLRQVKQTSGDNHVPDGWIEVPEGANRLVHSKANNNNYHFINRAGQLLSVADLETGNPYWYDDSGNYKHWLDVRTVWQRPTQPDSLPFVDDEPKLRNIKIDAKKYGRDKAIESIKLMGYWDCQFNKIPEDCYWILGNEDGSVDFSSTKQFDNSCIYVEYLIDDEPTIETAIGYQLDIVGSNTHGSRGRKAGESDISYRQYLMNFIIQNRNKPINDQMAEVEAVRQTLNQRQSQYGSFEDVAMTTKNIMDAIAWARGKDDLPAPHHEALHMIASKIARIVNGDHNHKDSWHDIQGYARLIEDLID